jgi:hypothetical protein
MISVNGCSHLPEIIYKDYKYEKLFFETHSFTFDVHLENFKDSIKISDLIRRLIYKNKTFDEYIVFAEDEFIGNIRKEYYPPMTDDGGTEYLYHSDLIEKYTIEYYNDSFVIIKYHTYFYYSGAAHGNYITRYLIIDLIEETILNIDDLILPIPDDMLKGIIEVEYETNYYLREEIWPPDTISFQHDTVSLLWNVYSIAPYSTGLIEIVIQDIIIESYFTEKGKALKKSMNRSYRNISGRRY